MFVYAGDHDRYEMDKGTQTRFVIKAIKVIIFHFDLSGNWSFFEHFQSM